MQLPRWPESIGVVEVSPRTSAGTDENDGTRPRDAKRARPAALEARVSTIELPGLGNVYSVLAVKGGELLLGTETALYHKLNGRLALMRDTRARQASRTARATRRASTTSRGWRWSATAACS